MSELDQGAVAEAAAPIDVAQTPAPEAAAPAAEAAPEAAAPTLDADLMAIWDKHHPVDRDDKGRFQSKNPAASEPAEAQAADPATEGQSPEEASSETARPSIAAPNSWPAEMKAKWETLPPDAAEYIAKRESEAHAQITRMGQQVKAFEPLNQVLEQHKDVFEKRGLTFDQGVSALLAAQRALETNPVAAIHTLAQQFGVDLAQLYGVQDAGSQPHVAALQAQIQHLQQQLAETSQRVTTREQRETEAQRQSLETLYSDFTKANPDFAEIEDDVVAMIPAIRAKNPADSPKDLLAKAYEQAKWANPAMRAKLIEAENKRLAEKAAEEARKKAAEAKKAASVNVRGGQNASAAAANADAALHEIAMKHYGRIR